MRTLPRRVGRAWCSWRVRGSVAASDALVRRVRGAARFAASASSAEFAAAFAGEVDASCAHSAAAIFVSLTACRMALHLARRPRLVRRRCRLGRPPRLVRREPPARSPCPTTTSGRPSAASNREELRRAGQRADVRRRQEPGAAPAELPAGDALEGTPSRPARMKSPSAAFLAWEKSAVFTFNFMAPVRGGLDRLRCRFDWISPKSLVPPRSDVVGLRGLWLGHPHPRLLHAGLRQALRRQLVCLQRCIIDG